MLYVTVQKKTYLEDNTVDLHSGLPHMTRWSSRSSRAWWRRISPGATRITPARRHLARRGQQRVNLLVGISYLGQKCQVSVQLPLNSFCVFKIKQFYPINSGYAPRRFCGHLKWGEIDNPFLNLRF